MKTIVCIKQVPDTNEVKLDPITHNLIRQGVPAIINPGDLPAVETALQLSETHGVDVTVLTMGPLAAVSVLQEAVGMGVKEAILLSDPAFSGSDTFVTSGNLAKAIGQISDVGIVICGKQAIDGDTGQVGAELAEHLGFAHIAEVRKIIELTPDYLMVERNSYQGYQTVKGRLPVVITVDKTIHPARSPSLAGLIRAKNYEIPVWNAATIGVTKEKTGFAASPTKVRRVFIPKVNKPVLIFTGSLEEQVTQLLEKIRQNGLLDKLGKAGCDDE
jgi:electron transfer flavoprotein alpha/beta subunit